MTGPNRRIHDHRMGRLEMPRIVPTGMDGLKRHIANKRQAIVQLIEGRSFAYGDSGPGLGQKAGCPCSTTVAAKSHQGYALAGPVAARRRRIEITRISRQWAPSHAAT